MRTLKLALLLGMLAGCAPQIDRAEQELDVSPPLQRASLTTVREGGESPHSVLEIYPQQGQRLQDLVDLEIFRDLQPGLTFVEAEKLIGPPQERGTNNRGPYVIYHRAEGRVQIALQEYASGSASYRAWTLDGFPIRTLPGSVLHPRIVELLPADQKVEVVIMGSPLGSPRLWLTIQGGAVKSLSWIRSNELVDWKNYHREPWKQAGHKI